MTARRTRRRTKAKPWWSVLTDRAKAITAVGAALVLLGTGFCAGLERYEHVLAWAGEREAKDRDHDEITSSNQRILEKMQRYIDFEVERKCMSLKSERDRHDCMCQNRLWPPERCQ